MTLLTTGQVADRLQVSPDYVRAHAVELGAIRVGGRTGALRFEWPRVERWLEARRVQPPAARERRRPGPRRKAPGVDLLPLPGETR